MSAPELFNETRRLFHLLKRWAETLHSELDLSIAMRGVLELLLIEGPGTVPQMARARGVSRQHVQQQVDALLERGFVERQDNPAHKRSSLIVLSDKGRALIQTMRSDELRALARLQPGVSDQAIADAVQVLASWRTVLQQDADRRTS
jgi:DNA-binding MarR family transcriptional regulator